MNLENIKTVYNHSCAILNGEDEVSIPKRCSISDLRVGVLAANVDNFNNACTQVDKINVTLESNAYHLSHQTVDMNQLRYDIFTNSTEIVEVNYIKVIDEITEQYFKQIEYSIKTSYAFPIVITLHDDKILNTTMFNDIIGILSLKLDKYGIQVSALPEFGIEVQVTYNE